MDTGRQNGDRAMPLRRSRDRARFAKRRLARADLLTVLCVTSVAAAVSL